MKNLLDKAAIIKLKQEGLSNRGVARTLGIDKKLLINIGMNIKKIYKN